MMIIQDENRFKEQQQSRMSCTSEPISTENDQRQLEIIDEPRNSHSDLFLKSNNRRKQNKPNRVTNDEEPNSLNEQNNSDSTSEDQSSSVREESESSQVVQQQNQQQQQNNPHEAYCQLCERSFCNKYFLKTHLAKKHGLINLISPRSSSTENNDNVPISFSPPVSSAEQQTLPLVVQSTTLTNNNKPTDKFAEDYCEICQKKFCNKYYLRKHKGECHGIYTDYIKSLQKNSHESPLKSSSNRRSSPSVSNQVKRQESTLQNNAALLQSNTLLLNPFYPGPSDLKSLYPINSSISPIKTESQLFSSTKSPTTSTQTRSNRRCHLCEKEFRTKSLLRMHIATDHQQDQTHSSSPLLPTTNLGFLQPFLDGNSQLAQKVITGQTSQTTPYSFVQDAYFCAKMADRVVCEICNKQVCNKYFLKTHKAKVHGITSTDNSDTSNSENSETYCSICKKDFSTKYFYLFHMYTVHQDMTETTYQTFLEFLKNASTFPDQSIKTVDSNSEQDEEDEDEEEEPDENDDDQADSNQDKSARKRTLSQSSSEPSTKKRADPSIEINQGGLQPFLLDSNDSNFSQTFVPCMVYLPVLRRVTDQVTINLKLKPVLADHSSS